MRFMLTSNEFVYGLRPRPGFPLILNGDMEPADPFHSYLMWRCLGKGASLDQKTWEAYGRAIWDFAKFLDATRQQRDDKIAELSKARERNKELRAELDAALSDLQRLASTNETLRQEIAKLRSAGSGKVVILPTRDPSRI